MIEEVNVHMCCGAILCLYQGNPGFSSNQSHNSVIVNIFLIVLSISHIFFYPGYDFMHWIQTQNCPTTHMHINCVRTPACSIIDRENRRGNQELTIQRNWQHRVHKTKKNKAKNTKIICVGDHCTQTNINNVNKT
jgi:hypothetical protein